MTAGLNARIDAVLRTAARCGKEGLKLFLRDAGLCPALITDTELLRRDVR